MLYLLTHIFLYIVGAALAGWLIAYSFGKQKENRLLEDHRNLKSKHSMLEDYRDRINKDFYALKEQDREKSEEIAHLKRVTEDSRVKLQTFELENNDIQKKYESHSKHSGYQVKNFNDERGKLQQQLKEANHKIRELMDRHSRMVGEKKLLQNQIHAFKADSDLKMNNELHSLNSDRKKLAAQVDLLLSERNDYEERVKNLINEQSGLSAKIRELKEHEVDPKEIEQLTTQIIDIRNERDDYFDRLRTISNVIESCA